MKKNNIQCLLHPSPFPRSFTTVFPFPLVIFVVVSFPLYTNKPFPLIIRDFSLIIKKKTLGVARNWYKFPPLLVVNSRELMRVRNIRE